ncbi:hypothetical protein J5N97_027478 [Dioscorea zingiberensis]|uniref:Glutaredoxin domain-containing protein n=1 Tax=Dioscorea zingiberensis TaxID=325984 RepID=A0A9D5C4W9_9LILI|nr:hypothetical protein J5N97_027478 [Dioscorea zingiberensis]
MKGVKGRLLKKLKSFSDEEKENEKENIKPPLPKRRDLGTKNQDPAAFRRPDLNSSTLFDPGLLAAFREAVMDYKDKVMFYERDVSMHMEFREELWMVLGGRAIPPKLFIKGRYIGGADEVQGLHEQGKLRTLLKGLPVDCSNGVVCVECGGMKFLVCSSCHGSRKVYGDEVLQCLQCNENGLVLCSLCC